MSGEDDQLEKCKDSNNSVNEIIINDTSNDSVLEISDDDNDLIDLSHITERASEEDIDDLRIVFKSEHEEVVENTLEAVDNSRSENLECDTVNKNSLARRTNRKRTHASSTRSLKIARISSQNSDLTNVEFSDSEESVVSIKNEPPESSSISITCSSIKSGSERTYSSSTQVRRITYDLSRINWLRPLNNLSSPPHLQIVIIDLSHPLWRITHEKWLMIEKKLLEHLHDEMLRKDDTSIGLFDGAKWTRGIKVVGCGNQNSLDFITEFMLNKDNLWPGANLDVIPINQITRHIVRVFIPPPELSKTTILSFIKLQNPQIYCDDWEIIREYKKNGGRQLWISINTESYDYIRRTNGEIKFGINRIWFRSSQ